MKIPQSRFFDQLSTEARLALYEWRGLIGESLSYELQKRIIDSQILGPAHASIVTFEQNVKLIASRGLAARVKLSRILLRLSAALLNNNREALQVAMNDLLLLGKKVSQ
jgi:hypothetical protein